MYMLMYKFYFILLRSKLKQKNKNSIFYYISTKIIGYIEAYFNLYVVNHYKKNPSTKKGVTSKKRQQKIIISLTSYPKRINTLWIVIETLLRQTMKPDEIILWLAEEQFEGTQSLPSELLAQQKRGLTIRWCDDLRSHKKYFYVMQEYPEDIIILVDDDTMYSYDLVEILMKTHKKNPEDIIGTTCMIIPEDITKPPSVWTRPRMDERFIHSLFAQPFTGQGTLYPPHTIPQNAFDKKMIMQICPYADDLWLKFLSMTTGTVVTLVWKYRGMPIAIYGTPASSLWYINGQGGKNDIQWSAILEQFKDDLEILNKKIVSEVNS